jgi:hypothetical protein
MAENGHTTISLGGETFRVLVPPSFAEREDIAVAWRKATTMALSRRVYGMTLGLCVPGFAKEASADYNALDCDGVRFGRLVYDSLRSRGFSAEEITQAATVCYKVCIEALFPRKEEVYVREGFSGPAAAAPTE